MKVVLFSVLRGWKAFRALVKWFGEWFGSVLVLASVVKWSVDVQSVWKWRCFRCYVFGTRLERWSGGVESGLDKCWYCFGC